MSLTKHEKNKALVLEAFDTLFNKRDYVAAVVKVCSTSSRPFQQR
jgi:hypothetical protein